MEDKETGHGPVDFMFWGMKNKELYPYRRYELPFTSSTKIFHYTTIAGIKGIIDSGGVWISSIKYMNDADEIYHGRRIAIKVIKSNITKNRNKYLNKILEAAISNLGHSDLPDLFIACFSKMGDSLDLWRTYSKGVTGLSVGIDLNQTHHLQVLPIFTLRDVIYSDHGVARRVLKEIRRLEICIERDINDYKNLHMLENYYRSYLETFILKIEAIASASKNPGFKSETEVRLTYRPRNGFELKREYRNTDKFIIPYYNSSSVGKNNDQESSLPICEIIVGPSSKSDLVLESIRDYMRDKNVNANIRHSILPFRQI